jgi:hypothetical protein
MALPMYTQDFASLVIPANNIFIENQWDCMKNVVGRVNPRCQGIPMQGNTLNIFVANPWDCAKNVFGRVNPRCQLLGKLRCIHARKHAP